MSGITYEIAIQASREHYGPDSLAHAQRVADTAGDIATSYGHDAQKARTAGLLHDWARELPEEELMSTASSTGIPVTDLDREVPYLLHARVGAVLVREALPGLDDDIARSVENHTVGSGSMSWLDMVVYVADMLEPHRTFEAASTLREDVGVVGLEELFRRCYMRSIEHLVETRRHLHPDTVSVWNSRVAGRWEE